MERYGLVVKLSLIEMFMSIGLCMENYVATDYS